MSQSRGLIIIGAGGSGRQLADAVEDMPAAWSLLGYLDDDPLKQELVINGVPVLGKIDDAAKYPECSFITVLGSPGNPFIKKVVASHCGIPIGRYATFIHCTARVSKYSTVGRDTAIMPLASVMPNVSIGDHAKVEMNAHISHDAQIDSYVTIANSVSIAGRVVVGGGAYIGANASIREDVTVGEWSLVGIGSVVIDDVPDYEVWAGVPARFIRRR